ncbi:phosphatidylglycerophosphatase A [Paenibacillus sp. FSL R7-0048]|jgi:phosphatidylglycerophosphatase A|uniref:Phosphatidylglycerophosphatase A n=1 Tax=Paenibacillus odorifer TaxID=189426 RepID=A0ABX3GIR5_9BACL|nr:MULTISPECIES: phosphatidylglycerophosphatase A [Paenibacillus]MDH6430883.1 phosphatidylglycerophosphatase A [Paenibacillus sp. PastH-4]MDH6446681.1 phosphatidylglycerophosphatase A [Paenibacillus sp. PastF-4]MDH6531697.1 phosphatidylglycerophosphatase A [Paenibacillus sp. PastH-3]OMC67859.1 phosphatidylglycerophosphatase A [Paenibacillus odorifer]OMC73928.1 phosphatidylglycerophosphatase A [Paenibacillus odorifer]
MADEPIAKIPYSLNSKAVADATKMWLNKRGVNLQEIAELVMFLQKKYYPNLTMEECVHNVEMVLSKREVQNAVLTGIQLDMLAEEGKLFPPLQDMIENDEGLYGVDEILAFSIVNVYGSIGFTNYGYVDKLKPGVLERLNDKNTGQIHTFLDDIVGAVAAAASSRIAHRKQAEREIDLELPHSPEDREEAARKLAEHEKQPE